MSVPVGRPDGKGCFAKRAFCEDEELQGGSSFRLATETRSAARGGSSTDLHGWANQIVGRQVGPGSESGIF